MKQFWTRILDRDFAVPHDQTPAELLDSLLHGLTASDPTVRDELVYPIFATWVENGHFDDVAEEVGDRVCALLTHPEIQARTFAPLIIAELITRDTTHSILPETAARRWFETFAAWWLSETDLRGYDSIRGWLHAVAHGADAVGAFSAGRHSDRAALLEILDLVTKRILSAPQLWDATEAPRVALAVTATLARAELEQSDIDAWLGSIGEAFARDADEVPIPAWRQNLLHFLNALYVHLSRARVDSQSGARWRETEPVLADAIRAAWPPLA